MTPCTFREIILDPGLALLQRFTGLVSDDRARLLLLAIAGQESGWESRRQDGGPGRGFFQFERAGGVRGVLNHPSTAHLIDKLCDGLCIPTDEASVYEALAWSDNLAVALARLLLWTDPAPLPSVGEQDASYGYYARLWRPGRARPDHWPSNYSAALAAISKTREQSA